MVFVERLTRNCEFANFYYLIFFINEIPQITVQVALSARSNGSSAFFSRKVSRQRKITSLAKSVSAGKLSFYGRTRELERCALRSGRGFNCAKHAPRNWHRFRSIPERTSSIVKQSSLDVSFIRPVINYKCHLIVRYEAFRTGQVSVTFLLSWS